MWDWTLRRKPRRALLNANAGSRAAVEADQTAARWRSGVNLQLPALCSFSVSCRANLPPCLSVQKPSSAQMVLLVAAAFVCYRVSFFLVGFTARWILSDSLRPLCFSWGPLSSGVLVANHLPPSPPLNVVFHFVHKYSTLLFLLVARHKFHLFIISSHPITFTSLSTSKHFARSDTLVYLFLCWSLPEKMLYFLWLIIILIMTAVKITLR